MGARDRAMSRALNDTNLAKDLRSLLPRKNGYCEVNYSELLGELRHFGVLNRRDLRRIILRNLRDAIAADREPLDATNRRIYRAEMGDERFLFLERRQIFFGLEGLMRVILELEFGDQYREFADKRDLKDVSAA